MQFDSSNQAQIIWYETPEALDEAFWSPMAAEHGLTLADLRQGKQICTAADGSEVELSHEEMLQCLRSQGCWGFADTATKTIHAWAAAGTPSVFVVEMLAHEIGHLSGVPLEDEQKEEDRAQLFGDVAALALHMYQQRASVNMEVVVHRGECVVPMRDGSNAPLSSSAKLEASVPQSQRDDCSEQALAVDAQKISAAIDRLAASVMRMSQKHQYYNLTSLWDVVDAGRTELKKLESAQSAARQA